MPRRLWSVQGSPEGALFATFLRPKTGTCFGYRFDSVWDYILACFYCFFLRLVPRPCVSSARMRDCKYYREIQCASSILQSVRGSVSTSSPQNLAFLRCRRRRRVRDRVRTSFRMTFGILLEAFWGTASKTFLRSGLGEVLGRKRATFGKA